jgi:hypothetical protein
MIDQVILLNTTSEASAKLDSFVRSEMMDDYGAMLEMIHRGHKDILRKPQDAWSSGFDNPFITGKKVEVSL